MAKQAERPHPCKRRDALSPWKPTHLYVGDSGVVLCGRCMGTESTWTPWAWSDLGPMDSDREVKFTAEEIAPSERNFPGSPNRAFRCETDPKNRFTH